jgi:hypothetical protein
VQKQTWLWTLVVFFGASIVFSKIINATDDRSIWLTLGVEAVAVAAMVGLIVLLMRRNR